MVYGKTSCVIISTTFVRDTSVRHHKTTCVHVFIAAVWYGHHLPRVIDSIPTIWEWCQRYDEYHACTVHRKQFDTLRQLNIWAPDRGVLWSICATLINVFFLICKYTGKVVNVDFPKHLRSTLISLLHTFKRWQVKLFSRHVQWHLKDDNNCETTL